eukprot:scpid10209/ scgid3647/ Thyroid adenoma-associated protein homolog
MGADQPFDVDVQSSLAALVVCKNAEELRHCCSEVEANLSRAVKDQGNSSVESSCAGKDGSSDHAVVVSIVNMLLHSQDLQSKKLKPIVQALHKLLLLLPEAKDVAHGYVRRMLQHTIASQKQESLSVLNVLSHLLELPPQLGMVPFFRQHVPLIFKLVCQCFQRQRLMSPIMMPGSSELSLFLSKACLLLFRHYEEALVSVQSSTEHADLDDFSSIRESTDELFHQLLLALFDEGSSRDCCVMAGTAIALCLRASSPSPCAAGATADVAHEGSTGVGLYATLTLLQRLGFVVEGSLREYMDECGKCHQAEKDVFGCKKHVDSVCVDQLTTDHLWTVRLAVIHGLLAAGGVSSWHCSWSDTQVRQLWIDVVLANVVSACQELCQPQLRYLAFQVACELLQNVSDTTRKVVTESLLDSNCQQLKAVTALLFGNWDDTVEGLSTLVRKLFSHLLQCHVVEGSREKLIRSKWLADVLSTLSSSPWHVKGRYGFMAELIPHIGQDMLLSHCPQLTSDCLRCLTSNLLAATSGRLYKVCLQHLVSSSKLQNGGTSSQSLLHEWSSVWLQPIISALCSENSSQRQYSTSHYLLSTMKLCPPCVMLVVDRLSSALLQSDRSVAEGEARFSRQSCSTSAASVTQTSAEGGAMKNAYVMVDCRAPPCCSTDARSSSHGSSEKMSSSGSCSVSASRDICLLAYVTAVKIASGTANRSIAHQKLLHEALNSYEDGTRVAALAILCEHPCNNENATLLSEFVRNNMKSDSSAFRQQMFGHLQTALVSVRDYCRSLIGKRKRKGKKKSNVAVPAGSASEAEDVQAMRMVDLVDELLAEALSSFYPGAPYQRKKCGLQLMAVLMETFYPNAKSSSKICASSSTGDLLDLCQKQGKWQFVSSRCSSLLHSCMEDEYAEIRELALDLLSTYFQWPHVLMPLVHAQTAASATAGSAAGSALPVVKTSAASTQNEATCSDSVQTPGGCNGHSSTGVRTNGSELEQCVALQGYLQGVFHLVDCPRSGDNEIGAMLWKAVFQKLIVEQGYRISVTKCGKVSVQQPPPSHSSPSPSPPTASSKASSAESPSYTFIDQLITMLAHRLDVCRKDFLLGARTSPMHGCVLILRYCLVDILLAKPLTHTQSACSHCQRRQQDRQQQASTVEHRDGVQPVTNNGIANAAAASSEQEQVTQQTTTHYCWTCLLGRLLSVLQSAVYFVMSILAPDTSAAALSESTAAGAADLLDMTAAGDGDGDGDLPDVSPSFGDMGVAVHNIIVKSSVLQQSTDATPPTDDSPTVNHATITTAQADSTAEPAAAASANVEVHTDASSLHFQLVLHACWLLIKEASLLLGDVCSLSRSKAHGGRQTVDLLQVDSVINVGETLLNVLMKCRLKGAIESCALAFTRHCAHLLASSHPSLLAQPKTWLQQILETARNPHTAAVSITRLSAGLPLIIQSIVRSEPRASKHPLLHMCVEELLSTASIPVSSEVNQTKDFPQVHACNMLRALVRDTALGDEMLMFASRSLVLALDGLSSPSWAMRNASTLLFSVLLQRTTGCGTSNTSSELLGASVGSATAVDFFARYPTLFAHFLSLLRSATMSCNESTDTSTVDEVTDHWAKPLPASLQPLLVLLSSLARSSHHLQSHARLEEFVPFFLKLSSCPVLAVRVLSARCLNAFISDDDHAKELLMQLLREIPSSVPAGHGSAATRVGIAQNTLHGTLLKTEMLWKMVSLGSCSPDFYQEVCQLILGHAWLCSSRNTCSLTRTAAMNVWRLVAKHAGFADVSEQVIACSLTAVQSDVARHVTVADGQWLATAADALLESISPERTSNIAHLLIKHASYDVRLRVLQFISDCGTCAPLSKQSQDALVECVRSETNRDCLALALKCLLVTWQGAQAATTATTATCLQSTEVLQVVLERLSSLLCGRSKVLLSAAVPLAAYLLERLLKACQSNRDAQTTRMLSRLCQQWCTRVSVCCQPEQQDIVREAVAQGLVILAPHLFRHLPPPAMHVANDSVTSTNCAAGDTNTDWSTLKAHATLCAWRALVCLVEDDQPAIRQLACKAATVCFTPQQSTQDESETCMQDESETCTSNTQSHHTVQANIVFGQLHTLACDNLQDLPGFITMLADILIQHVHSNTDKLMRLRHSDEIFLHEDANVFAEPTLLVKLTAKTLKHVLACRAGDEEVHTLPADTTCQLEQELQKLVKELTTRKNSGLKWKGVDEVYFFRAVCTSCLLYQCIEATKPGTPASACSNMPRHNLTSLHRDLLQMVPEGRRQAWAVHHQTAS